jgi:DNA-binding GntR family transcriptional regulator
MPEHGAVQWVYLELRDLIVRGVLAPGSPLIERRVAELVGASRSTARGALQHLAREGFVTVSAIGSRYSRFLVAPLTIAEMKEWYYLFGALDGIAARGAALLPADKRVAVAEAARDLAQAHYEAGSGPEPRYEQIQTLDSRFHGTYVEAGGGPLLLRKYASFRPHVDRYGIFYATALIRELPSEVLTEHLAIVDAIRDGDTDAAERAAVANWRNASVRFAEVMRTWGERGNWEAHRENRAAAAAR